MRNHFLEDIAKFRAARRLWAHIMRDRFGATSPRAQRLRFHAQTAGSRRTAQQPDHNVVCVALQAFAAVVGSAQALHTNSRDEALSLPTETAVEIALRTQQILAAETHVTKTIDPVGDAYAIESLTDTIEEEALAYSSQTDDLGGAVKAIELGFPQNEIQQSAYRHQREVEARSCIVVGVNAHILDDEPEPTLMHIDPRLAQQQVERLAALRAKRDVANVHAALAQLETAARGTANLMPPMIEAVA